VSRSNEPIEINKKRYDEFLLNNKENIKMYGKVIIIINLSYSQFKPNINTANVPKLNKYKNKIIILFFKNVNLYENNNI